MKNELILARYTGQRKHGSAQRLRAILDEFGLHSLLETRFAHLPPAAADQKPYGCEAPRVGAVAPGSADPLEKVQELL